MIGMGLGHCSDPSLYVFKSDVVANVGQSYSELLVTVRVTAQFSETMHGRREI